MTITGCTSCGSKSPKEIKVVLPTGNPYSPDIEILANGRVTLQLYGSQKPQFWLDFTQIYKATGSWEQFPVIPVSYKNQDYHLKFAWKEFVPGSGLYPFDPQ